MTFPEPIHGRLDVLPLDAPAGGWKNFERFCLEVVNAQPDVEYADFYGAEGNPQDGIDILARLDNGRERTYQCKKYKQFSKSHADKAIAENVYMGASEHVLLVACNTTRGTQDAVRAHKTWRLLDKQGISSLVRKLDREKARRIIEDHFGTPIRRAFLGGGTTTFAEPQTYFAPFDRDMLFRHTWALAGRGDALDELSDELARKRVVVLPGRGGIGKTRILRALAERLADDRVLFVVDDVPITAEAAEDLPLAEIVVVVDDVHRRDDLAPLLAEAARRQTVPARIVLATRPQALDELRGDLMRAGFAPEEIHVAEPLADLGVADTEMLARQALGPGQEQHAAALAAATRDCPLVTVVGGQLLASRAVDPELLERVQDFRDVVLSRWREEMIGQLGPGVDAKLAGRVLRLVSALAPLSVEDAATLTAVETELDTTAPTLLAMIGTLEAGGLLLARGRLRRVIPDVLADHVLHQACLDPQGRPTGYANDLVLRYGAASLQKLLRNLAELDWRIGQTAGASVLLDEVWDLLAQAVETADAAMRVTLLRRIRPSAVYAPARVLDLVRLCLAAPAPDATSPFGTVTDDAVRSELPALLARVGTHPELVAEVMAMLWELGRDDPRKLHSHPEHPIRLAHELGSYAKSPQHTQALLDLTRALLDAGEADTHVWSPLILLKPLVEREVDVNRLEGFAIQIGTEFVIADATKKLRGQVFALTSGQAREGSARSQHLAVELLGDALQPPYAYGRPVAPKHVDQWHDEELDLIGLAAALIADGPPLTRMELRLTLSRYTDLEAWPDVAEAAHAAVNGPVHDDERMLKMFGHPWDVAEDLTQINEILTAYGEQLAASRGTDEQLAARLDSAIATLDATGNVAANPTVPLIALGQAAPDRAAAIAGWLAEQPQRPLARFAGPLLRPLRATRPERLGELLERLDHNDPLLRRQLASYLSQGAWFDDPSAQEIAWMGRGVRDDDLVVRSLAIHTLPPLSTVDRALAVRLALEADTSAQPSHASIVDHVLGDAVEQLTGPELDQRLATLRTEPKLEWSSWNLLQRLGAPRPDLVMDTLIARVQTRASGFEAIPRHHDGDVVSGLDTTQYHAALERILEAAAAGDGIVAHQAGKLFWTLDRDDDISLDVLKGWLTGEDLARCRIAASVLTRAPLARVRRDAPGWELLIARPAYVERVLDAATARSDEHASNVASALHSIIFGGVTSRGMGGIDTGKESLVAQAGAIVAGLVPGSAARRFWAAVIQAAEAAIQTDRLEDEEFGEELE